MRIERIVKETRARLRWLRAVRWGSWGLVGTLSLSALYVGLSSLHWVSDAAVPWLAWVNLAGALLSAAAGMAWRVNTQRALFELDRRLRTGELLLTLDSLKRLRRQHDFVPILEDQLVRLKVRPQEIYHLDASDLRRGGGIVALVTLVLGWLWFGPMLLQLVGLNSGLFAGTSQLDVERLTAQDLPPELQQQWEELRDVLEYFGYRGGGQSPEGAIEETGQDQLIRLFEDLDRAQDQLLGLNRSNAPSADVAADQARREQQRERLEQLQQQLQEAIEQAQAGQGPSPQQREQLEQALETLPQEDPLRRQIEQALQQQDPQLQQEALQQAQEQLNERLEGEQQAQSLRESVEDWVEQEGDQYSPEDLSDFQPRDANGDNGDGDNPSNGQGDQQGAPGGSKAQEAAERQESGEKQRNDEGQDLQAGEEGGTGPDTSSRPDVFEGDPWDPKYRNAHIPSELLPADAVQEWLSRGVPVESQVEAGKQEQFRLSYDQVEALLDLRDLPAEVRDVVRLYFLQLISQLNEGQPAE